MCARARESLTSERVALRWLRSFTSATVSSGASEHVSQMDANRTGEERRGKLELHQEAAVKSALGGRANKLSVCNSARG